MRCERSVNVIEFAGDSHAPLKHPVGTSDRYTALGVSASLDEVFECPMLVKHVLADESPITYAFLAERDDDEQGVFENTDIRLLYSPNFFHRKVVSRFVILDPAGLPRGMGAPMTPVLLECMCLESRTLTYLSRHSIRQHIFYFCNVEIILEQVHVQSIVAVSVGPAPVHREKERLVTISVRHMECLSTSQGPERMTSSVAGTLLLTSGHS
jgi:hypothetical protein